MKAADEEALLSLSEHLPSEASDAVLILAGGGKPEPAPVLPPNAPFEHPDAQRRFRLMENVAELEQALEYPWDKWTIFLHPAQRQFVEADYNGPARVSGSAGTGKTVVALHRAAFLARNNPDARVLLTTFSEPLANLLRINLRRLLNREPRLAERIEIAALDAIGPRVFERHFGTLQLATQEVLREMLAEASASVEGNRFSVRFLLAEWEQVVDAWQLETWEAYRDVARLGRRTRLPEQQRRMLWSIFELVRTEFASAGMVTNAEVFTRLASYYAEGAPPPFDHVVVDEAQDLSIAQLRFLAALSAGRRNSLFFAGDLGQRIFQQPFSWLSLGVDVRGRSRTLRINYRTSHQIRTSADRLLGPEVSDVDGNIESRRETVSVFNGLEPEVATYPTMAEEATAVGEWIARRIQEGTLAHEIAIFVRSDAQLDRAREAIETAGQLYKVLDHWVDVAAGHVSVSTMHLAKGLEFRAVVVMACDDEIIPLQERIETVANESDLQEVYESERHLLYVACTRARDFLLVTSGDVPSEFLADLTA